jgi:hypothetical protein
MSSPSPQRRVPLQMEPLADLEKGTMSDGLWQELNSTIRLEAASLLVTGSITSSITRNRGASPGSQQRSPNSGARQAGGSPSSQPQSRGGVGAAAATSSSSGGTATAADASPALRKYAAAQRFPTMERYFGALAAMGLNKAQYRGLALLHNAAQLGVWQAVQADGPSSAQVRAAVQERAAAGSAAIDEHLQGATERARALREEQRKDREPPGESYLKDLQRSRIDAEFERMRDQLRAEDAARREQVEVARDAKAKTAAEQELAERKRRLAEERAARMREREEKQRELRAAEQRELSHFESALREHHKIGTTPAVAVAAAAAAAAAVAAPPAAAAAAAAAPARASAPAGDDEL